MQRWVLLLCVLMVPASSFAGSISYDFRFDMQSKDYDEASNKAGSEDFFRFNVNRGRLDFQGKLNDDVVYRLRMRFNTAAAPTNERDSLGNWIDYAYVTHKVYDVVGATFGKFASDLGGYEAAATADSYAISNAYNKSAIVGATAGVNFQYYTGIKTSVNIDDQEFALHFANAESTDHQVGGQFSQNKMTTGIVYKGRLFHDLWNPLFAIHQVDAAPGGATKGKFNFLSLGNRFLYDDFTVDVDILSNNYKDETPGTEIKNNAIVFTGSYKLGTLLPKFQLISGDIKNKAATGTAEVGTKQTGTALALEYTPDLRDKFRYHLAYVSTTITTDGVATSQKITEMIFGTRLYGDFLKN